MIAPQKETEAELTSLEDFQVIEDVPLRMSVELDRRAISFRALLDLNVGTIVPLSRATGENVDVYAGNVLVALGEILVVDSKLTVRIADLRRRGSADDEENPTAAADAATVQAEATA